MSSLQALQLRAHIYKDLDLGGHGGLLSQNFGFEAANIHNLTQVLYRLSQNQDIDKLARVCQLSSVLETELRAHKIGGVNDFRRQ